MAKYGELTDLSLKGDYKNCLVFKFMRKKGIPLSKKKHKNYKIGSTKMNTKDTAQLATRILRRLTLENMANTPQLEGSLW